MPFLPLLLYMDLTWIYMGKTEGGMSLFGAMEVRVLRGLWNVRLG